MKKIYPLLIGVLILTFTSCTKEKVIEKSTLQLSVHLGQNYPFQSLNLYNNDLSISAELIPETVGDSIEIKITTNADTQGFILKIPAKEATYRDGYELYSYKRANKVVYAANHTAPENRRIKVDEKGDIIYVEIKEVNLKNQFPVNTNETISITYWPAWEEATIFLYGYNFQGKKSIASDGSSKKEITVWTDSDNMPVTLEGQWNDPDKYQAKPGFTDYTFSCKFVKNTSSDVTKEIYVNDGDNVYIEYNDVTYVSLFKKNIFRPLPIFQTAK
jgi:hypothetical protein